VQAAEARLREGRVGRCGEQHRQHRPKRVADRDCTIDPADADVNVTAERVVSPGDVLERLLDQPVVRRVDDLLVLPTAPGMHAGRAERDPEIGDEREKSAAALALAGDRVREVLTTPGADLDLRCDQLADGRVGQEIVSGSNVIEVVEAVHERQCVGVEEPELFLQPDGEVRRGLEYLPGTVTVERHGDGPRSDRSTAHREGPRRDSRYGR
jgi:hypothetical protein